jgi:hypothetical protein
MIIIIPFLYWLHAIEGGTPLYVITLVQQVLNKCHIYCPRWVSSHISIGCVCKYSCLQSIDSNKQYWYWIQSLNHTVIRYLTLQVRLLPGQPERPPGHCLAHPLQRHLWHLWTEAWSHAATDLQTMPPLLQLACKLEQLGLPQGCMAVVCNVFILCDTQV